MGVSASYQIQGWLAVFQFQFSDGFTFSHECAVCLDFYLLEGWEWHSLQLSTSLSLN